MVFRIEAAIRAGGMDGTGKKRFGRGMSMLASLNGVSSSARRLGGMERVRKIKKKVLKTIYDPLRREILDIVANKNINLNAVAEHFNISRPAISKHIKILAECGLIVIRQEGRDRYCAANLAKLNEVSRWVDRYRVFWTGKLKSLEQHLDVQKKKAKKSTPKKTS